MAADVSRLRLLLVSLAGWINRQQHLIEYLIEENHVLREERKGQRLRLTNDQRRRLGTKGVSAGPTTLEAGRHDRDAGHDPTLAARSDRRELAALKQVYSLATEATPSKLYLQPHIPTLKENNVRKGFFERPQFEAVRQHLPEALRAVVTFMYITGWRIEEALSLRWHLVDFKAGVVCLYVGETKNDDACTFPFTPDRTARP
jgi:integrase